MVKLYVGVFDVAIKMSNNVLYKKAGTSTNKTSTAQYKKIIKIKTYLVGE